VFFTCEAWRRIDGNMIAIGPDIRSLHRSGLTIQNLLLYDIGADRQAP
jgi:hypothetical protein